MDQAHPRTVWPWFVLPLLSFVVVWLVYLATWPVDIPSEDKLVKMGGLMQSVRVRDELTNSNEGSLLPALTSTFFRFKGDEREYRYRWTHPNYYYVTFYTSYNFDIWVDKDELARTDGKSVMIWALQERNPYKGPEEQTRVTYQDSVDQLESTAASVINLASWTGSLGIISLLIGFWTLHWNRQHFPAFKVSPVDRIDHNNHISPHPS